MKWDFYKFLSNLSLRLFKKKKKDFSKLFVYPNYSCERKFLKEKWIKSIIQSGFPDSSMGKESACNTGDPCWIPGQEDPLEKGSATHFPFSWASLVAQLVKKPPAMLETWVQSLGWEDPLEKGKATHSSILGWRIAWTAWSMESQRFRYDWATFTITLQSTVSKGRWANLTILSIVHDYVKETNFDEVVDEFPEVTPQKVEIVVINHY